MASNPRATRRCLVLVASETTNGVEASPVPNPATDAQLISSGGGIPINQDTQTVDEDILRDSLTPGKILIGRTLNKITLQTYLMGRGVTGAGQGPPSWSPLLKACGFSLTAGYNGSTSSSWTFAPISKNFTACTIYTYMDGLLFKALGCLGTWKLDMEAGALPKLTFDMTGTFVQPTEAAMPAATMPNDIKEMVQSEGMTIGSFGDADGMVPISFNLDWATGIRERKSMNAAYGFKGTDINGRKPTLKVKIEAIDKLSGGNVRNFFDYVYSQSALADGSMDSISLVHGQLTSGARPRIGINVAAPQLTKPPTQSDTDGGVMYDLDYRLRNTTAEGEFGMWIAEHV